MKLLKITEETEKLLITVFDAALKAGGFQMSQLINKIIASIEEPQKMVVENPNP